MRNAYRKMMERHCLSDQADMKFYDLLENEKPKRKVSLKWKTAIVVACIIVLVLTACVAADNIFGIGIFDTEKKQTSEGEDMAWYKVEFDGAKNLPVTEFAEKWRTFDGYAEVPYESWADAEAAVGINVMNSSALNEAMCTVNYCGREGQLCFAQFKASHVKGDYGVAVEALATAEHPTCSEELLTLHSLAVGIPERFDPYVESEKYVAQSGLTATVVTESFQKNDSVHIRAIFYVNGVSYRLLVTTDASHYDENKAFLYEVLEGFAF